MSEQHDIGERLAMVERKLLIIEATKGTLKLCTGHVALLWAVMASLLGVAAMVLHTEWVSAANTTAVIALAARVETHVTAPGHAISLERLLQMQATLNEVKVMIQKHMDR